MNRLLRKKIDESVAEQRGWHWAITSFGLEAYGASEKDLAAEGLIASGNDRSSKASGVFDVES